MTVAVTTTGLQNAAAAASTLQAAQWAIAIGTPDLITAAYPTPNTALTDGLILGFRASAANATATPTFSPDGLTAHTITKGGGAALSIGDIANAGYEALVRYNASLAHWELLNPMPPNAANSQITITGTHTLNSATENGKTLNLGGNAYYTLNCGDASTFPGQFTATIVNTDRYSSYGDGTQGRAKKIQVGGGSPFSFKLYPGCSIILLNVAGVWFFLPGGEGQADYGARWKIPNAITLFVDPVVGSSDADGFTSGVGAYQTINQAVTALYQDFDLNNNQCRVKLANGTYTETVAVANTPVGCNFWYLEGNLASPGSLSWNTPSTNAVCLFTQDNAEIGVSGLTFYANGQTGCSALAYHQYSVGDVGLSSIGTTPKNIFNAFPNGYHFNGDTNAKINVYDYDCIGAGALYHVSIGAGCIFSQATGFTHAMGTQTYSVVFNGSSPGCFIALAGVYTGTVTGQKYAMNGLAGFTAPGVTVPGSTAGALTNGAVSF